MFENSTEVVAGIVIYPNSNDNWVAAPPFETPLGASDVAYLLPNRADLSVSTWVTISGVLTSVGAIQSDVNIFSGKSRVVEDVSYIKSIGGVAKSPEVTLTLDNTHRTITPYKLIGRKLEILVGETSLNGKVFSGRIYSASGSNRSLQVVVRGNLSYWDKNIGSIISDTGAAGAGKILPIQYGDLTDSNAYMPVNSAEGSLLLDSKGVSSVEKIKIWDANLKNYWENDNVAVNQNKLKMVSLIDHALFYEDVDSGAYNIKVYNPPLVGLKFSTTVDTSSWVSLYENIAGQPKQSTTFLCSIPDTGFVLLNFAYLDEDTGFIYFSSLGYAPLAGRVISLVGGALTLLVKETTGTLVQPINVSDYRDPLIPVSSDYNRTFLRGLKDQLVADPLALSSVTYPSTKSEAVVLKVDDEEMLVTGEELVCDAGYYNEYKYSIFQVHRGYNGTEKATHARKAPLYEVGDSENEKLTIFASTDVYCERVEQVITDSVALVDSGKFDDFTNLGKLTTRDGNLHTGVVYYTSPQNSAAAGDFAITGGNFAIINFRLPDPSVKGTVYRSYLLGEYSIDASDFYIKNAASLKGGSFYITLIAGDHTIFLPQYLTYGNAPEFGKLSCPVNSAVTFSKFKGMRLGTDPTAAIYGLSFLQESGQEIYPFFNSLACVEVNSVFDALTNPQMLQAGFLRNHPLSVNYSDTFGLLSREPVDPSDTCEVTQGYTLTTRSSFPLITGDTVNSPGLPSELSSFSSHAIALMMVCKEGNGATQGGVVFNFTAPVFRVYANIDINREDILVSGKGRIFDPSLTYICPGSGAIENPVAVIEDIARREVGLVDADFDSYEVEKAFNLSNGLRAAFSLYDNPVKLSTLLQDICQEFNLVVSENAGQLVVTYLSNSETPRVIENKHILLSGDKAVWSDSYSNLDNIITSILPKYQKRITDDVFVSGEEVPIQGANSYLETDKPSVIEFEKVRDSSTVASVIEVLSRFRSKPVRTLTLNTDLTYYDVKIGTWVAFESDRFVSKTAGFQYLVVGKSITPPFNKEPKVVLTLMEAGEIAVTGAYTDEQDGFYSEDETGTSTILSKV